MLAARLELTYEWTVRRVTVQMRDQELDLSTFGHYTLRLGGARSARWRDLWDEVNGGLPLSYTRSFEDLVERLEWEWSLGDRERELERVRMGSPLAGARVRARRTAEGWEHEVLEPSRLHESGCGELAGAVGWLGLLPGAPVSEGTRWYVGGADVHELLRPLGRPRMRLSSFDGDYPELFTLLCRLLDPSALLELSDDRVTLQLLDASDGLAELVLAFDSRERLELADRALSAAEALDIEEETRSWLERATVDLVLDGGGRLIWSMDEERPVSARLEGEIRAELLLVTSKRGMRIRVELEGRFEEELAFDLESP